MREWPEGDAADPAAARERYEADMRAVRAALKEVLRADTVDAHVGLTVVVVATVVVGCFAGPAAGSAVAGAFAGLFLVALAVGLLAGRRGADAWRRAYRFSFGWGRWIVP